MVSLLLVLRILSKVMYFLARVVSFVIIFRSFLIKEMRNSSSKSPSRMSHTSILNSWKRIITYGLSVVVVAGEIVVVLPLSLDAWSRGVMCGGVSSSGIGHILARGSLVQEARDFVEFLIRR